MPTDKANLRISANVDIMVLNLDLMGIESRDMSHVVDFEVMFLES